MVAGWQCQGCVFDRTSTSLRDVLQRRYVDKVLRGRSWSYSVQDSCYLNFKNVLSMGSQFTRTVAPHIDDLSPIPPGEHCWTWCVTGGQAGARAMVWDGRDSTPRYLASAADAA
jgi:hypothetical protein